MGIGASSALSTTGAEGADNATPSDPDNAGAEAATSSAGAASIGAGASSAGAESLPIATSALTSGSASFCGATALPKLQAETITITNTGKTNHRSEVLKVDIFALLQII
jgi:hypothetical protein